MTDGISSDRRLSPALEIDPSLAAPRSGLGGGGGGWCTTSESIRFGRILGDTEFARDELCIQRRDRLEFTRVFEYFELDLG